MFVNIALLEQFQLKVKQQLMEFKDVFSRSYKELKGIPKSICKHKIELTIDA
jgi:hypothetical protein